MIAAHSLGSVVVHNHLVRKWTSGVDVDCVHDRLVTFGSPIGIITWLWLFLDFPGLVFNAAEPTGTNYFCQSPSSNAGKNAKRLLWVNVANALDPIATAFPSAAADLSRPVEEVVASLAGGQVHHRFLGRATATHAGVAHTAYLHHRGGFIGILLRAADLRHDDPLGVESVLPSRHWAGSRTALARLRVALWVAAFASALAYCAVVASGYADCRVMAVALVFISPRLTIWSIAFWQRPCRGGGCTGSRTTGLLKTRPNSLWLKGRLQRAER